MPTLRGTWYVAPTPFGPGGEVDVGSLSRVVDAAVRWGVDGVTVLGVMGEAGALSDAERDAVLDAVGEAAGARVPFAVGCSAPSVRVVAERARAAVDRGAVAVMVSAPPLLRDTDQLARFFEGVGAACPVPVVVQDEPAATGTPVPVSALVAAVRACGSQVVKLEDPPTPQKVSRLLDVEPGWTVFGGLGGVSAYAELCRGAAGTMTGFAYPEVLRAVREAVQSGDRVGAAAVFDRFLPLIALEGQPGVGLAIRKEVLRRRGVLATGRTRGLVPLPDPRTLADLDDVLARVGVVPGSQALDPWSGTGRVRGVE